MKSIIYLFISIIISLTLTSAVQKNSENTKRITLLSIGKNVESASLKQSADIMSSRLKMMGINSFEIKVSADKGQVIISLPENIEVSDIEGLLTSKGDLAFYETFTHSEIADLLQPDNKLFKLLNQDQEKSPSDPRVGCTTDENRKKTDEYLLSLSPLKRCKFCWGDETKKSGNCLFALKTNEDGKSLLTRSDIQSINIEKMADMQDFKIKIKLNEVGAKVFAESTKNNLQKSIAIVIDDKVVSWPRVQNAIEGGEVEITGNFTEKEAKYFPVIFNTEQLPLSFKLLK
jgi:preprotein translocase subunit SecD